MHAVLGGASKGNTSFRRAAALQGLRGDADSNDHRCACRQHPSSGGGRRCARTLRRSLQLKAHRSSCTNNSQSEHGASRRGPVTAGSSAMNSRGEELRPVTAGGMSWTLTSSPRDEQRYVSRIVLSQAPIAANAVV